MGLGDWLSPGGIPGLYSALIGIQTRRWSSCSANFKWLYPLPSEAVAIWAGQAVCLGYHVTVTVQQEWSYFGPLLVADISGTSALGLSCSDIPSLLLWNGPSSSGFSWQNQKLSRTLNGSILHSLFLACFSISREVLMGLMFLYAKNKQKPHHRPANSKQLRTRKLSQWRLIKKCSRVSSRGISLSLFL